MPDAIETPWTAQTLEFKVKTLSQSLLVDPRVLANVRCVDDVLTGMLKLLVRERVAFLAGEDLQVPASWWDHAKQRLKAHPRFPRWLRHWFQQRIQTIVYDVYRAEAFVPDLEVTRERMQYQVFPRWQPPSRDPGGHHA